MILRSDWVVPVSCPPIRDGYIRLDGPHISAVGAYASLPAGETGDVLDLGDAILTPGLVNPHTHLELTCYAGALPPAPFWDWIRQLIPLRAHPAAMDQEAVSVPMGAWQSLRAGVTCVGDISRCNISWRGLKRVPIRKVCFAELLSLADQPPRTPDELRTAFEEIEEDELLTAGVSPHAPYSVFADHLAAAVRLARQRRRPWCSHWAETREEVAFLMGQLDALPEFFRRYLENQGLRSPAKSAGEFLTYVAEGGPPGLLAHGNYLDKTDIAHLAAAGHSVVFCPRAHHFFGHSAYPLATLRAAGVRVVLGTDSVASNDDLSLLEEARFVRSHVAEPPPDAELLRMITLDAAAALGLHSQIGSLEAGKFADIAAFSCNGYAMDLPIAALLTRPVRCTGTWVAGTRVI